jgi:hypothetical protein
VDTLKEGNDIRSLSCDCAGFPRIGPFPDLHIYWVQHIPLSHPGYQEITADVKRGIFWEGVISLEVDSKPFAIKMSDNPVIVGLRKWRKPVIDMRTSKAIMH